MTFAALREILPNPDCSVKLGVVIPRCDGREWMPESSPGMTSKGVEKKSTSPSTLHRELDD